MRAGDLIRSVADLVLGARCAGCGSPGLGACAPCRAALAAVRPFRVALVPDGLPLVISTGAYDAELRRILLAAKERGALGLVPLLGERLAAGAAAWVLGTGSGTPVVLVPVPSARAQVAERGVDLPAVLARVAARRLRRAGVPASTWRGLRLVRRPRDQSGLGRLDRFANLAEAMAVTGPPPPGRLVVVDDIVTTGATLVEAVRALASVGRPPEAALTVAATRRRRGAR